MTFESPLCQMLHDPRMSAIARLPKTVKNRSAFERGLWQRKFVRDGSVPKRVFVEQY